MTRRALPAFCALALATLCAAQTVRSADSQPDSKTPRVTAVLDVRPGWIAFRRRCAHPSPSFVRVAPHVKYPSGGGRLVGRGGTVKLRS